MREYEVKEKARKQREEELRRRQEERQKRHEEQEKEKPESVKADSVREDPANASAEDTLGGSPISKTLFETVAEASNADGVVYYQHLYNKGKDTRTTENNSTFEKRSSPPSTSTRADASEEFESIPLLLPVISTSKPPTFTVGAALTAPGTSELVEDEAEEMRLRRELLKKRLKEWEDSSDEEKKPKSRTARHTEIESREKEPSRRRKSSDEDIQTKLLKFSQKVVGAETTREPEAPRRKNKSRSRSRSRRSRDKDRDRRRSRSRGRRDRDRKKRHSSSSSSSRSRSRDRRRRR
jgi:hypothetical protein